MSDLQQERGAPLREGERGASAVEYGLLVAAIAAVVVAVVFAVGSATGALFQESCTALDSQVDAGTTTCEEPAGDAD